MNPQHRPDDKRGENRRAVRGHELSDQFDDLFTVAELAALLRIPQATVRYWIHCGTGPDNFKIGRHVRYRRDDINTWLRRQRRTGDGADGPDAA